MQLGHGAQDTEILLSSDPLQTQKLSALLPAWRQTVWGPAAPGTRQGPGGFSHLYQWVELVFCSEFAFSAAHGGGGGGIGYREALPLFPDGEGIVC